MVRLECNGIAVEDFVVDLTVEADDPELESAAERMLIDLRDRAYRVAQAEEDGVLPEDAESHPASINWDEVVDQNETESID